MALIKCPECGKEISNTVKNCPHCGFAYQEVMEQNRIFDISKQYIWDINGLNINIMDIYVKNNQDCVKSAYDLAGIAKINIKEAKDIMFDFYDEFIDGRNGYAIVEEYVRSTRTDYNENLHCPKCRSSKLVPISDVNGKGVKSSKVCCLTALCGGYGTICGMNKVGETKTTHYWVCQDCGHRFLM